MGVSQITCLLISWYRQNLNFYLHENGLLLGINEINSKIGTFLINKDLAIQKRKNGIKKRIQFVNKIFRPSFIPKKISLNKQSLER